MPDKTVAEGKQATSMLNTHIQTQQRVWSKMSSEIYMASLLFSLVCKFLFSNIYKDQLSVVPVNVQCCAKVSKKPFISGLYVYLLTKVVKLEQI